MAHVVMALAMLFALAAPAALAHRPPPRRPPPRAVSPSPPPPASPSPPPPVNPGSSVVYTNYLRFADLPNVPTGTGRAKVLASYDYETELEEGVRLINPQLTKDDYVGIVPYGAQCANRTAAQACWETVSLWSSAAISPTFDTTGAIRLLGLADRGINADCPTVGGRSVTGFSIPRMAPSIMELTFSGITMKPVLRSACPMKDLSGNLLSGLPNSIRNLNDAADVNCLAPSASPKAFAAYPSGVDPRGLDPEGIVHIPGTDFCVISEEYGPSIAIVNCKMDAAECGTVLKRYTVKGSDVASLVPPSAYPVGEILPSLLLNRRPNRGFENIAISPSGKTVLVAMQSPLGLFAYNLTALGLGSNLPNVAASRSSHAIMIVKLDFSNPFDAKTTGLYVYVGDRADNTNKTMWVKTFRPQDIKLSDTAWAASLAGADPEAPIITVDERANSQIKVYLADFSSATNVLPMYEAPGADPLWLDTIWTSGYEAGVAKLAELGVVPVKKALLLDTGDIAPGKSLVDGWTGTEKQEGVLPLNKCVVALGEDDDFGISLTPPSNMYFVQLPACIDEVYKMM